MWGSPAQRWRTTAFPWYATWKYWQAVSWQSEGTLSDDDAFNLSHRWGVESLNGVIFEVLTSVLSDPSAAGHIEKQARTHPAHFSITPDHILSRPGPLVTTNHRCISSVMAGEYSDDNVQDVCSIFCCSPEDFGVYLHTEREILNWISSVIKSVIHTLKHSQNPPSPLEY